MSSSFGSRHGRPRDVEFKRRALEQLAAQNRALKQVADECGVSILTLLKWRRQLANEAAARSSETAAELERLREELAALRDERDRLRTAIAYLAGGE